jgi:hypothetical protein
MTKIGSIQDGLDVSTPDVTTPEEIEAYRAQYLGSNKGLLDSYQFWLEFRPDVLKRHKARTRHFFSVAEPLYPLVGVLAAIHHYTISAFREGVAYEIRLAHTEGALRTDILDTLSLAFIHSGHRGMYAAAASADHLREYTDQPGTDRFPSNWSYAADAFDSGMDYSTREIADGDMPALLSWYDRTLGEVPRYVAFLAEHRPGLLKAYRNRYEHAIRDSLPAQMLPYLMLNYNVARGFAEGIRENFLLGRALGMTREQLLDAMCFAVLFSGVNALGVVDTAVGDLL